MSTTSPAYHKHFDAYWKRVGVLLGKDPRHKVTAIKLADGGPFAVEGETLVRELFRAMDGPQWRKSDSTSKANWFWRDVFLPADGRRPKEVYLERLVAQTGGLADWTFQMPTSSGLVSATSDKRRSIDLVYRHAEHDYTFIELKGDADNPLYAAFEILGYGIAYLLARKHGLSGEGSHHVLSANHVDLMVLGPSAWYRYQRRNGDESPYELAPLATAIEAGLATVLQESVNIPVQMRFSFAQYDNACGSNEAAQEIVRMMKARRSLATDVPTADATAE